MSVTQTPSARSTNVLARGFGVVLVLLVAVIGFGMSRYNALVDRLDEGGRRDKRQEATIARQAAALQDQAASLRSIERLANAFARLSSPDAAERAAAREDLARLAQEAQTANGSRPVTTSSTTTTTTTVQRPPMTGAPTTTTTRACVGPLVVEVCRR